MLKDPSKEQCKLKIQDLEKIDIPGDTLPGSFGASLGGEATGVITGRTGGDFPGKSFTGIVAGAERRIKTHHKIEFFFFQYKILLYFPRVPAKCSNNCL